MRGLYSWRIFLKRIIKDYGFLLATAGIIVVLDQITKELVRANLPYEAIWAPWDWLTPYARIVHWYNSGVAFGMFQGRGDIFKILAFIVSIAIIYYFPRVPREDWILRLAMGMQLGGALGNFIDRLRFNNQVTDFISVGSFPVFNVADACISIGVGVLLLGIFIQDMKQKKVTVQAIPAPVSIENPISDEEKPIE
jgi:signal peptidase II